MAFTEVGKSEDLAEGSCHVVEVGGKKIALFRTSEGLRALDEACPHQGGPLSEGSFDRDTVTCPWHQWEFDLGDGSCRTRPGVDVQTYPVREVDGKLEVDMPEDTPAAPALEAAPAPAAAQKPEPREVKPGTGFKFLAGKRGEAVKHLLGFLGRSGDHLEPKTKYLIYVAMQTCTFSARGLRQYIPKAIKAGASEDEVIDAILQAYPGAGLGKVVDALDVFLALGYGGELEA